jgi:hypothetical protein
MKAKLILLTIALLLLLGGLATAQQSIFVPATTNQIAITGTVAASTRIVTGIAGKRIYVTGLLLVPTVAASVVTFTTGTGTNCGTSTANVTGALTFPTTEVLAWGTGNGALLVLPAGFDLCITIVAQAAPGALAYAIF